MKRIFSFSASASCSLKCNSRNDQFIGAGIGIFLLILATISGAAQPISGVWKGRMGSTKIELKLVRSGDSLIGTSYYYDSRTNYRRFAVKGYFDDKNNDVVWWDDQLIEDHYVRSGNGMPLLAVADFNCPGEGIMKLDGRSSRKDNDRKDKKELHLVKTDALPLFPDEWDFLIENYAYGVAHPELVDSIEQVAFHPVPGPPVIIQRSSVIEAPVNRQPSTVNQPPVIGQQSSVNEESVNRQPSTVNQTNEQRYITRKKILQQVIPVKGDSIELKFYDNAEIDGDSIAVFLNGRLLQEHILLAEQAYTLKIAVLDLQADNELVMVAENLGSIPPNTSLMVAVVDEKRYEAHLQSTEGSSALVRLVKP